MKINEYFIIFPPYFFLLLTFFTLTLELIVSMWWSMVSLVIIILVQRPWTLSSVISIILLPDQHLPQLDPRELGPLDRHVGHGKVKGLWYCGRVQTNTKFSNESSTEYVFENQICTNRIPSNYSFRKNYSNSIRVPKTIRIVRKNK